MSEPPILSAVRQALLAAGVRPGARLVVGCSGGPDSTALLLLLSALQGQLSLSLHAVYVDHRLRAAAAAEGAAVLALSESLELTGEVVPVTVPPGPSLQAAAREARYGALLAVARAQGAPLVLVGHTATDQAETLLMRLLGGAGLRGLGAMAPRRPLAEGVELLRPLLSVPRGQVEGFLAEAGMAAVSDPSNEDGRFLRARLRLGVLPLLRRERPGLDEHLAELSAQLREDAAYLDGQAAAALDRLRGEDGADAAALYALPPALRTRALQRLLGPLSRRQLEAVVALCRSSEGTQHLDLPGRQLERRYGRLHLRPAAAPAGPSVRSPAPPADSSVAVGGPGVYRLGPKTIRIETVGPQAVPAGAVVFAGGPGLHLRHPRPGDRLRLAVGRRKVSDVLIDAKVPRAARAQAVLLCRGDEVLWLAGHRTAASPLEPAAQAGDLLWARVEEDPPAESPP